MYNKFNIYLISVEYGEKNCVDFQKIYARFEKKFYCNVIRVRTDYPAGRFVSSINEAFEFSGYQEGLETAINDCKTRNYSLSTNPQCNFIFVNDTWLLGHSNMLSLFLIKQLLNMQHNPGNSPEFVGLKMPINKSIHSVTGKMPYISTWAFGLTGSLSDLQNVRFYSKKEVFDGFDENCYQYFTNEYKNYLKSWLRPTSLLKGWYKTIPGIPLDDSVFARKSLTIYLEHSLPSRLALQGFQIVDICDKLSPFKVALAKVFRKIDRINVVYLKLKLRVPSFFCALIKNRFKIL